MLKVNTCCCGSVLLPISCFFILCGHWYFVADYVFHVPLASWEAVAHSNIPFALRIKSTAHEELCNVVPAFSRTSELTTFPLAAPSPSTLACQPSSFLPQALFNTCCSLCLVASSHHPSPFLKWLTRSLQICPLPKAFSTPLWPIPDLVPFQLLTLLHGLHSFNHCLELHYLFICLLLSHKRAGTWSCSLLFLQEHRRCSYL